MTVAATAPNFLVEAVDRGGNAGMDDSTDVALVYTKAEGTSPHDDVDGRRAGIARPCPQDLEPVVGAHIAMEDRRAAKPRLSEPNCERVGRLLLGRVDDRRPREGGGALRRLGRGAIR